MKKLSPYQQGLALAFLNSLSLGFVGIVDKLGTTQLNNPLLFSAESVFFSFLITLGFSQLYFGSSFSSQVVKTPRSRWKFLLLVGICSAGIFPLLRFIGISQSTGTFATLSQVVTTAFTILLAHFFVHEKLSRSAWIFFVLILLSTYFVSVGEIRFVSMKQGDIFIIAGALFLAFGNIFSKIFVQGGHPIILSLGRTIIGSTFLFLCGTFLIQGSFTHLLFSPLAVISGFLWTINVVAFNFAIKKIGVTLSAAILLTGPVYTLALESLFLGRHFTTVQVVAALMTVVFGILLVKYKET